MSESIQKARDELISRKNRSRVSGSISSASTTMTQSEAHTPIPPSIDFPASESESTMDLDVDLDATARVVGIAAIKYADLSSHRESDIQFSMSKMLQFDGNTAPYLLYTYARANKIVSRMGMGGSSVGGGSSDGIDSGTMSIPMQFRILTEELERQGDANNSSTNVTPTQTEVHTHSTITTPYEMALIRHLIHYEDCLVGIIDTDHCPHKV